LVAKLNAIDEICQVESDDTLHDYGGAHGNKGNDFARFWLIKELLSLSQAAAPVDYLFLLEYVQDVALVNAAIAPTEITFYQLKKKENSPWNLNSLAGLTLKTTLVKPDTPLAKLLRSVLSFKTLNAKAEFVSNSRYKVDLEVGGSALTLDYLSLDELTASRRANIGDSAASAYGISAVDVPLERITLRYVPIEVNDMRTHVVGAAFGVLKSLSDAHAVQADSFVDALFAKLATASRSTSKCKTWEELVLKRGYSKLQFETDLASLQSLPNKQKRRIDLLEKLAQSVPFGPRETARIEVALTDLARVKLVRGELIVAGLDRGAITTVSKLAEAGDWGHQREYEAFMECLLDQMPEETEPRLRALAIYLMVEAWTNQTFA
jgi:hypothetical protein